MTYTETTPLLNDEALAKRDAVYRRFSNSRKAAIVAMVSACGLIPLFVVGTFTPSIPQIAKEMNSSGPVVNLAVSISALAASTGGLVGSSYSTHYGRRPVYLYCLPVLMVGSLGVALARSIPTLLFWRFFQSMGASPGLVLGAGAIGDIYKLEHRGRAMSVFFSACLLGPSLAPVAGGTVTYYYSWRIMQGSLGILGFVVWVMMLKFFPETSQPGARGVDEILDKGEKPGFIFINPLRPLWLLRSPSLFAIGLITSSSLLTWFVLIVPLAYTLGQRYNIANDALIGACFIPGGLGTMCGAPLIGRISDRTVIEWRKKRGGVWYPEDRLRAAVIPLAIFTPISVMLFGLANHYIDGTRGLITCLVIFFFNGVGVEMVWGPVAAYLVDVLHSRSTEGLAATGALRQSFMAIGIAIVLPLINHIGIIATNVIVAAISWMGLCILIIMIRHGDKMRQMVDIGFSTPENN
ncbi:major facilitator superfamily domain-containing protein [Panaeolus papilionaceus]|nr:major facilitator superfamily domain-containing protein [Panaeolus papilionaceus]